MGAVVNSTVAYCCCCGRCSRQSVIQATASLCVNPDMATPATRRRTSWSSRQRSRASPPNCTSAALDPFPLALPLSITKISWPRSDPPPMNWRTHALTWASVWPSAWPSLRRFRVCRPTCSLQCVSACPATIPPSTLFFHSPFFSSSSS